MTQSRFFGQYVKPIFNCFTDHHSFVQIGMLQTHENSSSISSINLNPSQ